MMLQHCGSPWGQVLCDTDVSDWCGSVQSNSPPPSPNCPHLVFVLGWARPEPCPCLPGALHSDLKDGQAAALSPASRPPHGHSTPRTMASHPYSYSQPDPYSPVLSSHNKKRPQLPNQADFLLTHAPSQLFNPEHPTAKDCLVPLAQQLWAHCPVCHQCQLKTDRNFSKTSKLLEECRRKSLWPSVRQRFLTINTKSTQKFFKVIDKLEFIKMKTSALQKTLSRKCRAKQLAGREASTKHKTDQGPDSWTYEETHKTQQRQNIQLNKKWSKIQTLHQRR